jgi:hypothetical protein
MVSFITIWIKVGKGADVKKNEGWVKKNKQLNLE